MSEIKHIGGIGWAIDKLIEHYKTGQVKGLMFQVLNNDGTFSNCRAGDASYLERLGMLESAKDDFRVVAAENIQ